MDIYLLDFKGAYLHSTRPTSTPVYLYDIPGIKTPPDKMIYLNKGLYGTLDAGNLWRQTVEKLLLSNGYTQAINDPCLFYKTRTINGKTYKTYIATWVDDLLIVSNDPEMKNMKKDFEEKGFGKLPVCIAKTQYSFSTDPNLKGAPTGHVLPVREVRLSSGAEFVVVVCGEIMTMPGLPRVPAADSIKLNKNGDIEGLF
mgnify:CR=1 FL=1